MVVPLQLDFPVGRSFVGQCIFMFEVAFDSKLSKQEQDSFAFAITYLNHTFLEVTVKLEDILNNSRNFPQENHVIYAQNLTMKTNFIHH